MEFHDITQQHERTGNEIAIAVADRLHGIVQGAKVRLDTIIIDCSEPWSVIIIEDNPIVGKVEVCKCRSGVDGIIKAFERNVSKLRRM